MPHVLVTGGSGFFGGILKRRLLREGNSVVNIDLERDEDSHAGLTSIRGDIRDHELVQRAFAHHRFDAVYHVAAQLAHGIKLDEKLLWTSNVDATRLLAETAARARVRPFVFVSSNCLWAANLGHPVEEDLDWPAPVEIYGRSKLAGEQCLQEFRNELDAVILRCPTIMDAGRLGLLAILYEFMDDGKTVWVVGKGDNRYQFIYAEDLATACILAASHGRPGLFHVGSDHVKTMREVYESVIRASGGRSRVRSLPRGPTIAAMKTAHALRLSPLGPYHYKMIAEDFIFDTSRAKNLLRWNPTLTNEQMLLRSYEYYANHRAEIAARDHVSAHRKPASMGIIRLLKWIS
ncbi:MAG TPA: NAD(P)-dependent oxidoreductase [Terracidiphilus sp.]|nr:NAD(P)-dependent oxidoreductase [Terracidiphilus sp.]